MQFLGERAGAFPLALEVVVEEGGVVAAAAHDVQLALDLPDGVLVAFVREVFLGRDARGPADRGDGGVQGRGGYLAGRGAGQRGRGRWSNRDCGCAGGARRRISSRSIERRYPLASSRTRRVDRKAPPVRWKDPPGTSRETSRQSLVSVGETRSFVGSHRDRTVQRNTDSWCCLHNDRHS